MDGPNKIALHEFWPLALLWLPVGAFVDPGEALTALVSLVLLAPCGLPLVPGCRRLWRLGYRRSAWAAGIGLGHHLWHAVRSAQYPFGPATTRRVGTIWAPSK
ncbi:MAG: hypothetical protein OXC93_02430 [Rhodospirillaceae bacterium]|nr:hypothetical protein [Rhodospirillaceae bacterium]